MQKRMNRREQQQFKQRQQQQQQSFPHRQFSMQLQAGGHDELAPQQDAAAEMLQRARTGMFERTFGRR
jgi:hypothetical protein